MKQSSFPGINSKKHFQIIVDPECYSTAERCGYSNAIFEGDEIKGNVELELAKPEMVKCIRLQLIGFISKSKNIDTNDVLKYINNPENPGGAIPKAIKMLSIDSYTGSSSNNKNTSDNSKETNNNPSKYDNLTVLVDYDVILWGKMKSTSMDGDGDSSKPRSNSIFSQFKGKSKENKDDNYDNRKDMINHKFIASRLSNELIKLPFSFKLRHITDNTSIPLPSSYDNGRCQIEYFLYATIHRPWPSRNSVRMMKLRVLQKLKIDIPKYVKPTEQKKIKELKFMKYIKKGLIEMNVKLPQTAYCHRDNIPIEVTVNHLGMNRPILGFAVGLYEKCSYEDASSKKMTKYSFKLVSERFYEYQVKPGESSVFTILNFPIIDGHCSIQKKFLKTTLYSSRTSNIAASNSASEESVKDEKEALKMGNEGTLEDEDLGEEEVEDDITRIQLRDVKVPYISPSINEPSRWPVVVEHTLRVVAITNENKKIIRKMTGDDKSNNDDLSPNENEPQNNDFEEYVETDSQLYIHVSPPPSPSHGPSVPAVSNGSLSNQNNGYLDSDQYLSESRRSSTTGTKELINAQNNDNQKYINENKKYGIILGHLSNGDVSSIPKSRKALDFEFNIVIGTMTRTPRLFGKEFKLEEEIEDQYFNAILRKNNFNNKLKLRSGSISGNSNNTSRTSLRKDDESNIKVHTRIRTNSSSNDSYSVEPALPSKDDVNKSKRLSPIPSASVLLNKELPVPPQQPSKDEKKVAVLPQQPPTLPPRNLSPQPLSSQPTFPSQPPFLSQPSFPSQPPFLSQPSFPSQPPFPSQPQFVQSPVPYEQMFPNLPQFANPQEYQQYQPSAPTMDDLEAPPPYEYDPNNQYNSNNQYSDLPEKH